MRDSNTPFSDFQVELVAKHEAKAGRENYSRLRGDVIKTLAAEPDFRMEIDWDVHCWVCLMLCGEWAATPAALLLLNLLIFFL